jgi:universal stress protein A
MGVTKDKKKEAGPQNILIPTDFSAASKNAFRYALDLGREGSRFLLLNVITPKTEKGRKAPSLIAAARRSLTSFAKNDHACDARSMQSLVRIGTPFEEILAAARDRNADLIVLGVHDSEPFGGLAVGRTVDRVSRYAKCPVLLVREPEASASATVGIPLLRG